MKVIKCHKCDNENIKIEDRYQCSDCLHNGYYLDDEFAEKNGVTLNDWSTYYDEEQRARLSKVIGSEIERCEAGENGTCKMGEGQGDGCWLFYCHDCGTLIDLIPRMVC